ncbi:restriction endonuclease subunit S [Latilactobacillus curvatus]|uniref:restriction endonuclease subunit S n=1 Tax=Latilactobacillus curvatus TaxID=28038 RepID=UPI00240FBD89|nr:restriction endonuclease subunit S [Latilactobacillus curvatus]MDG2982081.1 restriction endonuclease subunit S [Latilactobacillus curvatus]
MSNKVPQIRFNGYIDDWEERNLSDLATFSKGKGYSKSDLVSDGFPAILYGRMYTKYESQINDVNDTFVADTTDAVLSQTGDVIVPGSGETPEDIARASNVNVSGVVLGGDINIIRPDAEKMDSTFLALTISNGQQQTELIKRAQGKSVVHLHNSDLKKVNVVAPSKDEQRAISSLFNQLDNLIAANQRKLDLLKEQKKGYLQKMFPKNGAKVPELRFAGFADDWEERKLGDAVNISSGVTGDATLQDGKYRLTRIESISQGMLNVSKLGFTNEKPDQKYLLNLGDILYSNINSLSHIGKVALVDMTGIYHGINLLRFQMRNGVDSEFLFQRLNTMTMKNWAVSHANPAVSQASINQTELSKQPISSPTLTEQQQIGNFFKEIDNTIALHQRKLDLLKEQKKGFLEKMFV